ncbi:hypothetical protein OH77DRAFT_315965 [Trametes cingulata]|nr:hypothetical protein OH77DRAFT_315965 [Trametes cingulata]
MPKPGRIRAILLYFILVCCKTTPPTSPIHCNSPVYAETRNSYSHSFWAGMVGIILISTDRNGPKRFKRSRFSLGASTYGQRAVGVHRASLAERVIKSMRTGSSRCTALLSPVWLPSHSPHARSNSVTAVHSSIVLQSNVQLYRKHGTQRSVHRTQPIATRFCQAIRALGH